MSEEPQTSQQHQSPLTLDVSDWDIVTASIDLLKEGEPSGAPLLMSKLGQLLSVKLGTPLRQVLGDRRLRPIMERIAGPNLVFEGAGQTLSVRLHGTPTLSISSLRYDTRFWAAFAKPILDDRRRFIQINRPFNFDDIEVGADDEPSQAVAREITAAYIPNTELPKPERDALIRANIDKWCKSNRIDQSHFLLEQPRSRRNFVAEPQVKDIEINLRAVEALVVLMEATPPEKRTELSLDFSKLLQIIKK